jgi:hypothetical protein
MADDSRYRSQALDPYPRDRPSHSSKPQDDPLAELARLIGRDEVFIAASRESARARQRDAQSDRKPASAAPSWLGRGTDHQRPDEHRPEPHAHSEWRDAGRDDDFASDAGHQRRQGPTEWEERSEEHDREYGGRDARDDWHGNRSPADEEFDPRRIAGDRHYDDFHGEGSYAQYDEDRGLRPRIDPFDSPHEDAGADEERDSGRRRRGGILTVVAVLGLAVVGTAAAFGYRAWTGGSSSTGQPPLIKADTAPTKVVPAQTNDGQQKLIYDRIGEKIQSSNDRMVSREEQPVELRDMAQQPGARAGLPVAGTPGNVTIGGQPPAYAAPPPPAVGTNEPKKVHTITIRPDQMGPPPGPGPAAGDAVPTRSLPTTSIGPAATPAPPAARAAPSGPSPIKPLGPPAAGAPLALNAESARPGAAPESAPSRTAALPAPSEGGNYVVQISSQRSEAEAQASFRALQAKYPTVLGSRQAVIRRADLGSKGVYYRAQVGPFATAEDANQLCSNLKAAGGQCIVQRN